MSASHGIQAAPSHGQGGHWHAPAGLPFSDGDLNEFQASDMLAGKMIIILLSAIFAIGLLLYTTIAIIVALPTRLA